MSNYPKIDVFWSPSRPENYMIFQSDLKLYKVEKILPDQDVPGGSRLSEFSYGKLLSQNNDNQFPKCMAWYPKPEKDYLVAVGRATGSITLSSLDPKRNDELINKEYTPKQSRPCFCVGWSPENSSMLAAGLDRCRSDSSLLIWDINKLIPEISEKPEASDKRKLGRPLYELGSSECTSSLAWVNAYTILAGMNKYIRVFDLREATAKNQKFVNSKAVFGVCVDPLKDEQVASYVENHLCIWDLRYFDKCVITKELPKHESIVKLAWSPKRQGLLGCVANDAGALYVYDIVHVPIGPNEYEHSYKERLLYQVDKEPFASFDWHPFEENRLITVNTHGQACDHRLFERISLDLDPYNGAQNLIYSHVRNFRAEEFENDDDIGAVMRQRALKNYGLKKFGQRLDVEDESRNQRYPVKQLWEWIGHMTNLTANDKAFFTVYTDDPANAMTKFVGIMQLLKDVKSKQTQNLWEPRDQKQAPQPLHHYSSPERDKCLKICQWPNSANSVHSVTSALEEKGLYKKASAIALFHGYITEALDILNRGSQGNKEYLSIVAMALFGLSATKDSLDLTKFREWHNKVDDPHLRAMFTFLTCDGNYKAILQETNLSLSDRVAFACLFLNDAVLFDCLQQLQVEAVKEGDLSGILLTGLEENGVQLLQQYVDKSGDLQTAALAMVHSFPSRLSLDKQVASWIDEYRNLLDKWKLWVLRSEFDIFHKQQSQYLINQMFQIHLSCNFCKKPIAPVHLQHQRKLYMLHTPNNSIKTTICHDCRKPLPRCSLCLKNMGTLSGFGNKAEDSYANHHNKKVTEFSNWFTWCQSCHHGGHANHIEEWFFSNTECPVTGCTCKCKSLDSIPQINSQTVVH